MCMLKKKVNMDGIINGLNSVTLVISMDAKQANICELVFIFVEDRKPFSWFPCEYGKRFMHMHKGHITVPPHLAS